MHQPPLPGGGRFECFHLGRPLFVGSDEPPTLGLPPREILGSRWSRSKVQISAVSGDHRQSVPHATLIFDRFHVQRLVHDALDEVRRDEVRAAAHDEKAGLKKTRWALQKKPWNLTDLEKAKLADLEAKNLPIYRAYLLKESLLEILDRRQVNVAARKLDEWVDWAQSSGMPPFVRAANTIQRHREGLLAYVRTRLNNGRVEGLNGKARVITRRAFGFHSASSLIAMLFLCCGGIEAHPAHVTPYWTH